MTTMSLDAIDDALARHHVDISAEDFLAILADATGSTDTLTDGERQFLVEHGGVDPIALTDDRQQAALHAIAVQTVRADVQAYRSSLTTREVSERYGMAPANIRRMVAQKSLYVAGRTRRSQHLFPAWQFREDGPLPGLREVIEAIPGDFHPLDVETFMTTANEALDDRSPAAWLSGGGDPGRIAELAAELGYR